MAVVFHWNGHDLPESLRDLPEGTYVLEAVAPAPDLTVEEERGLIDALASADAGQTIAADEVRRRLEARLAARR